MSPLIAAGNRRQPRVNADFADDGPAPAAVMLDGRVVRRLPAALPPADGEAFPSWMDRLAANANVSITTAAFATGVAAADSARALPAGWGVWLPPERIEALAAATGQSVARVSETLLASWDQRVFNLSDFNRAEPATLARAARRQWAWFAGSPACGECLAEPRPQAPGGRVWPMWWRLPFACVCPAHSRLLVAHCPVCAGPLGNRRADGRAAPSYPSLVPTPGRCVFPPRADRKGPGVPCGADLTLALGPTLSVTKSKDVLLSAQQQVQDVAYGATQPQISGRPVPSLAWFSALRQAWSLTAYASSAAAIPGLGECPVEIRAAVEQLVDTREMLSRQRSRMTAAGGDYRATPRVRHTVGMPRDPSLVAALLPTVVGLLADPESVEFGGAVDTVVTGLKERDASSVTALTWYTVPDATADAIRVGGNGGKFFSIPSRSTTTPMLLPSQIPRALWANQYAQHLAPLLDGFTFSDRGRLACSLLLIRHVSGCTWVQAGEAVGGGPTYGTYKGNAFVTRMRQAGVDEVRMGEQLAQIAEHMAAQPRVDWSARRTQFAAYRLLKKDWKPLADALSIHVGQGTKRKWVSSWLWAELTGNLWHESPEYSQNRPNATQREVFWRWWNREGCDIQPDLQAYLATILGEQLRVE